MNDELSSGDDHIHDQHEYPIDYEDDDEDFKLSDHDSLHNIHFEISENSNLNGDAENENGFINDERDDIIADDNIDLQKDHIKTKINSIVDSYGATLSMYNNYESEEGFDVRLGTIRTTKSDIITQ
ncbi:unnamed protein product [Lactuca saligna]|uniref:Uncharacterized protein n=1 Tax=Lactuca saligna TaxID=75948 RepID=A0AA35ZB91_LACSI|nr:unnamed protein product [Lactuca saligna]